MPSFAVGRTQQLVLLLHELMDAQKIPSIPIFVDSPLAINATEVFRRHPECYDEATRKYLTNGGDPFGFRRLFTYVREASESKKLNDLHGPFIVIAASGMCEAGRILHHLRNNIGDPRNTVLITGFQAEYTLGRKILQGDRVVPIFGEPCDVRAEVDLAAGGVERSRRSARTDRMDAPHSARPQEGFFWFTANHLPWLCWRR